MVTGKLPPGAKVKEMTAWSDKSMAFAERERRALVTVIDGHVAIVLPQSLAGVGSAAELAALIARLARAVEDALRK